MSAIDWERLGQPEFDRQVEALFMEEHKDLPQDAYVVNGRGGDDGIDIQIRRDGRLIIVQLKFFPEGFSGGWVKRREQIRRSFKSALAHDPDEWWLVVPWTVTIPERRFLDGLLRKAEPPRATPVITVFDRPKLDGLAGKHPGLVGYFHRDELREAAQIYGQERALLQHRDDVVARVGALSRQADTLHPDWRFDLQAVDGVPGLVLMPKHPQAALRSPINISFDATFGPAEKELGAAWAKAITYGTPEAVELPGSLVSNFRIDGPEFIASSGEPLAALSLIPWNNHPVGQPIEVSFSDGAGATVATYRGKTTWLGAGPGGFSVRAAFFDSVLQVEFLLPADKTKGGQFNFSFTLDGADPAAVVRTIRLIEQADAASAVTLQIDDQYRATLQGKEHPGSRFADAREDLRTHSEIADDLVVVQEATSRYFPYPAAVTALDRAKLRAIRLLLEGRCVVVPNAGGLTAVLSGEYDDNIRMFVAPGFHSISLERDGEAWSLFGQEIPLGSASLLLTQVEVVDVDSVRQALEAGTAEGRRMELRCREGYGVWIYLRDRYVPDADDHIRPVSLGLDDIDDAPDVARAAGHDHS